MRPYIARVCGFARGAAECKKKHKRVQYTGACCTSMYPISDLLHLLHLRNAILIGKQKKQPSAILCKTCKATETCYMTLYIAPQWSNLIGQ